MNFSTMQWTLLLTEWAFVYTGYRFLRIFFDTTTCQNKKREFLSYILFSCVNSLTYMIVFYPWLQAITTSFCFFLLSFNYQGRLRKRVFAVLFITAMLCMVEIIPVFSIMGIQSVVKEVSQDGGVLAPVLVRIADFMVVLFCEKLKNIRRGSEVPFVYRFIVSFIPMMSMALLIYLTFNALPGDAFAIVSIVLLETNFLMFYLYDSLIELREKSEAAIIINLQNDSYKKQMSIMQEYMSTTKSLRHDAQNHVLIVQSLLEQQAGEQALEYVQQVTQKLNLSATSVNSGNIELDSLLNYKMGQAKNNGMKVNLQLTVPERLAIDAFDLVVIVGNLWDNAVDAILKLSDTEKELSLTIRYSKGRLLINVTNPYTGLLLQENGRFKTNKKNAQKHGIGLESVRTIVQKYHGEMDILTENEIFSVHIILYTDKR